MSDKLRIYEDPKLELLPDFYDRDIVKILTRNPREAFVIWAVSSGTFKALCDKFSCEPDQIHLRLVLHYTNRDRKMEERIIELPPFTPNWLVKFDQPVKNLKAELGALANGRVTVILHSALTDMPSNKPSMLIHREWVSKFWVLKYALGDIGAEFHELTEEHFYPENYEFPEETPSIEQQNQTQNQNQTFLGSSGNFLGSSNLSYSSGNIWREER